MTDDLIRRTYERAAELAERAARDPGDAYARRWARTMQLLGDWAADGYRTPSAADKRGVERRWRWATARWRNGRLRVRLGPPVGLLDLCCRIGIHFLRTDHGADGYRCRCRREHLWFEEIRR